MTRVDSGLTTEGWFSGAHGVMAIKEPGRVQFDDRAAGVRLVCRDGNKLSAASSSPVRRGDDRSTTGAPLLGAAAPATDRKVAERNFNIVVRNQSWQRAKNGTIELLGARCRSESVGSGAANALRSRSANAVAQSGDVAGGCSEAEHGSVCVSVGWAARYLRARRVAGDFPVVAASDVAAVVARGVASTRSAPEPTVVSSIRSCPPLRLSLSTSPAQAMPGKSSPLEPSQPCLSRRRKHRCRSHDRLTKCAPASMRFSCADWAAHSIVPVRCPRRRVPAARLSGSSRANPERQRGARVPG